MLRAAAKHWLVLSTLALSVVSVAGCGGQTQSTAPTATSPPLPTITPEVTFAVQVTAQPTPHRPKPTPLPRPTPVIPQSAPYILLAPDTGPPLSRTIEVRGGHFPKSSAVRLSWSPNGKVFPIGVDATADARGNFSSKLSIPGAAPGRYLVVADVDGVRYASARYHVVSMATLTVRVLGSAGSESLQIVGRHFVAGFDVTLVAYPGANPRNYTVLGIAHVNPHGSFTVRRSIGKLVAGQYVLRGYSRSTLSAESAETYFQLTF